MDKEVLALMIPIVAIVMTLGIPIAWFYFDHRNKRARYQAMERLAQSGQDPKMLERMLASEPKHEARNGRRTPYKSGLICVAIGLTFMIGSEQYYYHDGPPGWIGLLLLLIGLALLISDFLARGDRERERERQDRERVERDWGGPRDPQPPAGA